MSEINCSRTWWPKEIPEIPEDIGQFKPAHNLPRPTQQQIKTAHTKFVSIIRKFGSQKSYSLLTPITCRFCGMVIEDNQYIVMDGTKVCTICTEHQ